MHKNKLVTIKKRHEFVHAFLHGKKIHSASMILQFEESGDSSRTEPRFGITVTKKLGSAVVRNKIKRRIRHLLGEIFLAKVKQSYNYIFIAKSAIKSKNFQQLKSEFLMLIKKLENYKDIY